MEEKLKIIFFASGDFPYPTLEIFLEMELYDVVGIVTSNYKPEFRDNTIKDLAIEHEIPYLVIDKNHKLNSFDTVEWLRGKNADIFCVISFKYLPREILSIPKITSFNVHASLLPFLRGAAPINWAIRYGFKTTGLTSFVLDEHIDTGEIIENLKISLQEDDDYGKIFKILSKACIGVTLETVRKLCDPYWRGNTLLQPDCEINIPYMKAPKLTEENMTLPIVSGEFNSIDYVYRHIQSLSPNIGTPAKLQVYKAVDFTKEIDEDYVPSRVVLHKEYTVKIYKAHMLHNLILDDVKTYLKDYRYGNIATDGKNFMILVGKSNSEGSTSLMFIDEIQIAGKKKLPIKDFLAGFQLSREKGMYFTITGKE